MFFRLDSRRALLPISAFAGKATVRRSIKRTLVVLSAIGAVLAVGLTTTTIVNAVATATEQDRIEPYGQTVVVDGREMNVLIAGEGATDIVLLPGFGTASPVLDFEPLVSISRRITG